MGYKSQVSASTALSDTTEKLIDTLTVPGGVTKIVGIAGHALGGAGNTTLENVSGKLRIRNKSRGEEFEFLLDCTVVLAQGVASVSPRVWPTDIVVAQSDQIEGYMTMDLAQTIGNTGRFMIIYG